MSTNKLERIIMHWTAGGYTVRKGDSSWAHYHYIVDGNGNIHKGCHEPEDNLNVNDEDYAAHTKGLNTGSIGVSIACMAGATTANPGKYPPKPEQVNAFIKLVADLCKKYQIPVTVRTVLCHSEVQTVYGKPQSGKWDIEYLPWSIAPHKSCGDWLRSNILKAAGGL